MTSNHPRRARLSVDSTDEPVTLSVEVASRATSGWVVTVLVEKLPDTPRINADELHVRMLTADGDEVEAAVAPSGDLVEAGGGLGVTASAVFEFAASDPDEVVVQYRSLRCSFGPFAREPEGWR